MSIQDVDRELVAAGVPRSRRQIIRYCETAMLDAVKVPGPTGPQWYVSPASLPKAIGDLKQWEAQRASRSTPQRAMAEHVIATELRNDDADTVSHGEPYHATTDDVTLENTKDSNTDMARRTTTDYDIYEHLYVKKLEERCDKLEAKYDAQVRRTEDIQLKAQQQLVELQRMTTIGQNQTLADFMLKAKDWILGPAAAEGNREVSDGTVS
jgi:hypothetical protein